MGPNLRSFAEALVILVILLASARVDADARQARYPALIDPDTIAPQPPRELMRRALSGDLPASEMVAGHFQAVGTLDEGEYWTTIAAENGSVVHMVNIASLFLLRSDAVDDGSRCRRAMFWYERALVTASQRERRRLRLRESHADIRDRVKKCLATAASEGH
jgi:hypothetical protein